MLRGWRAGSAAGRQRGAGSTTRVEVTAPIAPALREELDIVFLRIVGRRRPGLLPEGAVHADLHEKILLERGFRPTRLGARPASHLRRVRLGIRRRRSHFAPKTHRLGQRAEGAEPAVARLAEEQPRRIVADPLAVTVSVVLHPKPPIVVVEHVPDPEAVLRAAVRARRAQANARVDAAAQLHPAV